MWGGRGRRSAVCGQPRRTKSLDVDPGSDRGLAGLVVLGGSWDRRVPHLWGVEVLDRSTRGDLGPDNLSHHQPSNDLSWGLLISAEFLVLTWPGLCGSFTPGSVGSQSSGWRSSAAVLMSRLRRHVGAFRCKPEAGGGGSSLSLLIRFGRDLAGRRPGEAALGPILDALQQFRLRHISHCDPVTAGRCRSLPRALCDRPGSITASDQKVPSEHRGFADVVHTRQTMCGGGSARYSTIMAV